jgi:hypothetical protein
VNGLRPLFVQEEKQIAATAKVRGRGLHGQLFEK